MKRISKIFTNKHNFYPINRICCYSERTDFNFVEVRGEESKLLENVNSICSKKSENKCLRCFTHSGHSCRIFQPPNFSDQLRQGWFAGAQSDTLYLQEEDKHHLWHFGETAPVIPVVLVDEKPLIPTRSHFPGYFQCFAGYGKTLINFNAFFF